MQASITHKSLPVLIMIAALTCLQTTGVQAQNPNYVPTVGFDKVKTALERLENAGDEVGKEARQELLVEGKRCLEIEQQYVDGKMPIIIEAQKYDDATKLLNKDVAELMSRINAFKAHPGSQAEADKLNREAADMNARLQANKDYLEKDLQPRMDAENKELADRYAAFVRNADKLLATIAQSYRNVARAYQEKRKFAETLFASKEHFPARCAVVLSAALNLQPEPRLREKSLADLDSGNIDPAFRGAKVLERFYVQAQQLADRLARDWHQMERYDDWQTARAKVGGQRGVIFFRDADFRRSTLKFTGDHIDVWDGTGTGSGYTFRSAKEIWFWKLPN